MDEGERSVVSGEKTSPDRDQDERENLDEKTIRDEPEDQTESKIQNRRREIEQACKNGDLVGLAKISVLPGGFQSDTLRRKTWTVLLGCDAESLSVSSNWDTLPRHRDETQVELDVNRSFVYYPDNESESKLQARRNQLSRIIVATLRQYPMLCYFQGYHDIVQVLLLVLGEEMSQIAVSPLSLLRIRDFMLPVLAPSLEHLQLLTAIIVAVDPDLARHLTPARPFFALSSTLTMFAHDIEDYQVIARLFDFLLAHEASLSMYLFATIIMSRRKELFEIEPDDEDMLHFSLSKLPQSLDFDSLIVKAIIIFQKHPPESLPLKAWSRISRYSVLKTTRSKNEYGSPSNDSIQTASEMLSKQTQQVHRRELCRRLCNMLWRNRAPIGGLSLAILVGMLSVWIQRNDSGLHGSLTARLSMMLRSWL